jgi:hypothetical protein
MGAMTMAPFTVVASTVTGWPRFEVLATETLRSISGNVRPANETTGVTLTEISSIGAGSAGALHALAMTNIRAAVGRNMALFDVIAKKAPTD